MNFQELQKTHEKNVWKQIVVKLHSSSTTERNTPCFILIIIFSIPWIVLHEGIQEKWSLISSGLRGWFMHRVVSDLGVWAWHGSCPLSPPDHGFSGHVFALCNTKQKMIQALRQGFTYGLHSPCTKHCSFWLRLSFQIWWIKSQNCLGSKWP